MALKQRFCKFCGGENRRAPQSRYCGAFCVKAAAVRKRKLARLVALMVKCKLMTSVDCN